MLYKYFFFVLIISLSGCKSSDENSAPTVELSIPALVFSLEQVTFTANINDPENDTVNLRWQLTSDAGENVELNDAIQFDYTVPLISTNTIYQLVLTATDASGNVTTVNASFTVPAVEVEFTLPFDAVSQRYVDVIADVSNISAEQVEFQWSFSSDTNYPVTNITPQRIRFFAAKELTEEYEPNDVRGPEYVRGEGVYENVSLLLTVSNSDESLSFEKPITIKPFQQITPWPEHEKIIENSKVSEKKVKNNAVESLNNCSDFASSIQQLFDYNQDGTDDIFCAYNEKVYFYLSKIDQTGDVVFIESFIIDAYRTISETMLLDLTNDAIPELIFIKGEAIDYSQSILTSLRFNQSTQAIEQNEHWQFLSYEYNAKLTSTGERLLLAYFDTKSNSALNVLTFSLNDPSLPLLTSLELLDCSMCDIEEFTVSDIGEQGVKKVLLGILEFWFPFRQKSLYIIDETFENYSRYPRPLTEIRRENIDDDPFLEWLVIEGEYQGVDFFKPKFKKHLSLSPSGDIQTTLLENYYVDLYFNFYPQSVITNVNHDDHADTLTKQVNYRAIGLAFERIDEYDSLITFSLNGNDKQVLVTSMQNKKFDVLGMRPGPLKVEDIDNDGDLDIVFDVSFGESNTIVTVWLENINGYPFN